MAERISETAARSPATTFDIRDYRLSDSGRPRWRPGSRDQAGSRSDGRKEHWRDDVCASRQFRSKTDGTMRPDFVPEPDAGNGNFGCGDKPPNIAAQKGERSHRKKTRK